jgi:hypothetical protein
VCSISLIHSKSFFAGVTTLTVPVVWTAFQLFKLAVTTLKSLAAFQTTAGSRDEVRIKTCFLLPLRVAAFSENAYTKFNLWKKCEVYTFCNVVKV